jgi:MFS family permease
MKKTIKKILSLYFGMPKLTIALLPIVVLETLVNSFCLNISAYFKKVDFLQYDTIGQLISAYYLGCLFGAILGGILTLYINTTKISGWSFILLSFCFCNLLNPFNQWLIVFLMFFIGLLGTVVATSNITSLIRSVKENEYLKLKAISLDFVLFNLSYSFVTFILLDLSSIYIVSFINGLFLLLLLVGTGTLIFYRDPAFFPVKRNPMNSRFYFPKRKQEFLILMSMILCFGLIFSMVKVVFTPTLIERFGSNMISVTAASINPWVIFLIQPLLTNRIKNSNSIWFLGFGGLIVGLSYFMFGFVNSFMLTMFVLVLLTFGEMMFSPLSKHLNMELYGSGKEGLASGIWKAVFLGSGAIGPELSGYMAENYGTYIVWEFCAVLGLICFVLSAFLYQIKNKKLYNKLVFEN